MSGMSFIRMEERITYFPGFICRTGITLHGKSRFTDVRKAPVWFTMSMKNLWHMGMVIIM